ncbi:hypothetical protein Pmani_025978 [Petrolisthes manimaculis]|uniref:Protein MMS22-like n=1 Tax=Petrolisthes manimaculis TaxID=1843537 RepID=A0AAE1TXV5_9EUCA|nr:hypothetical protein Pmani_025978 [Petrolisthes manimaculis]
MTEAEISMTPPLTPPPPPLWSQQQQQQQQQQQEMDDIMMDSDSLDYLDFFTTDNEPSHNNNNNNTHQGGVDSVENTAVWFNCQGVPSWGQDVTLGSYLSSGCLSSLLHHNTPSITPHPSPPPAILQLPPCTPDNIHFLIHHYFMAIRHGITELERGAQSTFTPSLTPAAAPHTTQYGQLREDVAIFFTHLAAYTHSLKGREESHFLKQVDECVLGLLRYLGPLHHLQGHVTTAASSQGNKCPSAAYHLFHLHLDVRWWSLALLHTLPDHHNNPSSSTLLLHEPPPPPPGGGGGGVGGDIRGTGHDSFGQCASLVVWDLLHLLAVPTVKAGSSEVEDLVRWPCGCCVELGVSLLHILDHRAKHHNNNTQSFWEEARNKLLVLLKLFNDSNQHTVSTNTTTNTSPKATALSSCPTTTSLAIQCPSEVLRSGSLTHIWWYFYNLARLYVYDVNGNTNTRQSEVKVEPKLLRTLVRLTVGNPKINTATTTTANTSTANNTRPSETQLRSSLRCCVLLCGVWGPGGVSWEWVGPLWEHFSRRFNDSFTPPGANMDAHTTTSRTIGGWVEEAQRLGRNVNAWEPHTTSWQFFVSLLAGVARGGGGGGGGMGSGWRQVRGRVYSRFHSRLMGELSSTGLHHAASLFLTLATVTDPLDVITKLCELLVLVPSRGSSGRMRVVWRSFLACALLLVGTGADLTNLTHKFTPLVSSVVSQYTAARDPSTRRELGQLLVVYAEGVQEVFEESQDLSLSQHTLLCGSLAGVLPQVGISELKAVLSMLYTALTKVLTLTKSPHSLLGDGSSVLQSVVGVVWSEFGGFLRTHSLTLTPPRTLGEVAACLTLCLSHLPPPSSISSLSTNTTNNTPQSPPAPPPRDAAQTLVTHFLTSEAVNTGCCLHYGSWLLEHLDANNLPWSGLEGQLVSSWLCALVTQGPQDQVQEMSLRLTALPGVASVLPGPVSCPFVLARSLIKGVGDKFSHLQNFNERMTYRERASQYFNGLDRAGTTLLKKTTTTPPPPHLSRVIDIIADVILNAHQLIYVKSNPKCALPSLMSGVFLAAAVYCTDKTLPPPLTSALAPALPKVVRGLGSLGLSRDAYLLRCVKEIFTHYLPRYPASITSLLSHTATTNTSTTTSHPILVCLEERENVAVEMVKELRTIFLEVVRDAFLTRRSTPNTHTQIALSLVNEGIERLWVGWVEECCSVLLLPLLEILLSLDDHNTKRCTTHLLKQLLCRAQQSASPPRETMVGAVTQLVARHLSWSSGQVFRVLRVTGVMYRTLVLDALPYITRAVTTTEEKRGTGLDNTLRQGYQSLLSTLGINNDVYQVG